MSLRKKFSSLRKLRPGGVMPQNLLNYPVQKINIPTEHTVNRGKLYVVKPQSLDDKVLLSDIKSCFFLSMGIQENGLDEEPVNAVEVELVEYNGTLVLLEGSGTLHLCVSKNENYMFFKRGNALIDKMVLPKKCIQIVHFAENLIGALFVLQKSFGYMVVKFALKGKSIYKFLRKNPESWVLDPISVVSLDTISQYHQEELRRHENSQKDPFTVVRHEDISDSDEHEPLNIRNGDTTSDDILRSGLPSLPKHIKRRPLERQTRSASRQLADQNGVLSLSSNHTFLGDREVSFSGDDEDTTVDEVPQFIRETPAPFDPPLRHSLDADKKFIISYNDFKTLYNNDWINDTLIDFFIAYEMHKAVTELRLITKSEVFAFNSFFFTKLFAKTEHQQAPPYYENIRRWLNKVDLMSFLSVIIPINEHLHWYFVIIKNLPALLEYSKNAQNTQTETSEPSLELPNPKPKPVVDIFVIDSLKQTHTNLGPPLREVIKEYCKEKHGVDISTDLIRLKNARVSKQRNFNDCGIHVIYNITKWLENPYVSEQIWKTQGRSKSLVFKASERDGMRRRCIDLLLDLHSKQPPETPLDAKKNTEDAHSDDEVELISYLSSYPQKHEEGKESAEFPVIEKPSMETETETEAEKKNGNASIIPPMEKPIVSSKNHAKDSSKDIKKQVELAGNTDTRTANDSIDPKTEPIRGLEIVDSSKDNVIHEPSHKADTRMTKYYFQSLFKNKVISPPTEPVENPIHRKTLDPRVIDRPDLKPTRSSKRIETLEVVLHPQIKRLLLGSVLNRQTTQFLNDVFHDHTQRFSEGKRERMKGLIEEYNNLSKIPGNPRIHILADGLKEMLKRSTVPMDQPFVIKDPEEISSATETESPIFDDSNGDLNKSVGELSISRNKSLVRPTHESTPEATRQFLNQTEVSSPAAHDCIYRHTRSMEGRASGDIDSDLEIVDDDLKLVSEVSLVFSSPRERAQTTKTGSPKERNPKFRKSGTPTAFFSSPRDRSEVGDILEIQKMPQKSRSTHVLESSRNPKALEDSKIPSTNSRVPGTLKSSVFSQVPRSSKGSEEDLDVLEVTEVVHVPEEEETRKSPTRKIEEPFFKTLKRRRVESQEITRPFQRK